MPFNKLNTGIPKLQYILDINCSFFWFRCLRMFPNELRTIDIEQHYCVHYVNKIKNQSGLVSVKSLHDIFSYILSAIEIWAFLWNAYFNNVCNWVNSYYAIFLWIIFWNPSNSFNEGNLYYNASNIIFLGKNRLH